MHTSLTFSHIKGRRGRDRMVVGFTTTYANAISAYRHWRVSPLMWWDRISIRASCTTLCDKVCQWLAPSRWFSPVIPVSSTNKTDRHDIYPLHTVRWYKTLYQVEPVVWTSITTSRDSDELWCGLSIQQARPDTKSCTNTVYMYVISLSNISIKANFKQITRVEIRLLNLYNILRETTFCAWCHVYLLPFILLLC